MWYVFILTKIDTARNKIIYGIITHHHHHNYHIGIDKQTTEFKKKGKPTFLETFFY